MEHQDGVESCLECKHCYRENSERGMDYSNCVSVHSEQNAIISSPRNRMIGSTLYLVGIEVNNNGTTYVKNPMPCSLCKRMIINAGIDYVIVRTNKNVYETFNVNDWKNTKQITGGY